MRKRDLKMNSEQRIKLLTLLSLIQENSAPITLTIGSLSDNIVEHNGIIIKEAPPVVIEKLVKEGYLLDVSSDGVLVINHF